MQSISVASRTEIKAVAMTNNDSWMMLAAVHNMSQQTASSDETQNAC